MSSSKSAWGQLLSSRSSGYLTRVVKDSFEPFREIHFTTTWKCSARISLSVLAEIPYDGLEKTLLWRLISGKIQSVGSDCGLAPLPQLFELLTKRIPAASAIISQGLERWLSSTATVYYAKFFIVSDSQKRAGVMCRDFSRNDTLSVCIRHRFERAELWWRQSFFSCNATVLGDKLSSNRRCRKTPKTLVSQVLLPLKTKGKDKNEGFTYTMEDI